MLVSFVYLVACRLFALVLLLGRSDGSKEFVHATGGVPGFHDEDELMVRLRGLDYCTGGTSCIKGRQGRAGGAEGASPPG